MVDPCQRASKRATRALIDLDAIDANVRVVRGVIGASTRLMAVVKANAYGHGARAISETALAAGADRLGVATIDEALVLRSSGIGAPVHVLGPVTPDEIEAASGNDIEISAGSMEFIGALAEHHASPVSVHLKIDTGLRRFGVMPEEALDALTMLANNSGIRIAGVFSHFGQADESDSTPTDAQHERFLACLNAFRARELPTGLVHAANSAALLRSRAYDHDMVRLGISLYGVPPSADASLLAGMRPAMTIVSRVQRVFDLAPGDGVSYGATFRAQTAMRAALVPIGYGDGYPRALSNCGMMKIAGHSAPVIGRVCMDQTVVAAPTGIDVVVNDAIIVAGGADGPRIPLEEIAAHAGTNPYEIATAISARVPRVFLRNGEPVAIEDLSGLHRLG